MLDPNENKLEIDCCGVVTDWEFYAENVGASATIFMQIWRLSSGSTYEMVGQNEFTLSKHRPFSSPPRILSTVTMVTTSVGILTINWLNIVMVDILSSS